jgi:methyl-accepting chemotaxis protein
MFPWLQRNSIQTKIVTWSGLTILVIAAVIITISSINLIETSVTQVENQVKAEAKYTTMRAVAQLEVPLDTARAIAQALEATQGLEMDQRLTRQQVNVMLMNILEKEPSYLGIWTGWEPNAFDGKDSVFANTEESDQTGRFIPYWVRGEDGKIHYEPLMDYASMDYYLCPKNTRQECILDPYLYTIQGKNVALTTVAVPITIGGKVAGVVGVDIALDMFQTWADEFDAFENQASLRLIAYDGSVVAAKDHPEWLGEPLSKYDVHFGQDYLASIQRGEEFQDINPEHLGFFAPIMPGNTVTPWSINVEIGQNYIYQQAIRAMWQELAVGAGLALAGLVALWFLSKQITRPILKLAGVAQQVTDGRMDVHAAVDSNDEVGILARAFNEMLDRTRQMLDNEVRQRKHLQETIEAYVHFLTTVSQGNLDQRLNVSLKWKRGR